LGGKNGKTTMRGERALGKVTTSELSWKEEGITLSENHSDRLEKRKKSQLSLQFKKRGDFRKKKNALHTALGETC